MREKGGREKEVILLFINFIDLVYKLLYLLEVVDWKKSTHWENVLEGKTLAEGTLIVAEEILNYQNLKILY